MLALSFVTFGLLAAAAPASDTAAAGDGSDAPAREYQGPHEVTSIELGELEVVDPSSPVASPALGPSPALTPAGDAQKRTVAGANSAARKLQQGRGRRPAPRVLMTLEGYGYPDAEIVVVGKRKVRFTPGLQMRNQVGIVSPFTLDRFGNRYSEGAMATGRIRWNPTLALGNRVKLVGSLDIANGRWSPDGSDDPIVDEIIRRGQPPERTTLRLVDPRELYLEVRLPLGLLRLGQQAFTWGQGILANDGNHQDRFGDMRFGDDGRGDIFERVLFATQPFKHAAGNIKHLAIAIGGDLVFRDERVALIKGDLAAQALLALRYTSDKILGNSIGGIVIYRRSKGRGDRDVYPDDETLEVGVVDIAGQGAMHVRDGLQLIGAFETAILFGRTDNARDEHGTHRILQGGGVARGYVGKHEKWLVGFDAGYASGDRNPSDRWINNFTFDAGHTVGLVLFGQVNAWRSAQSEILATNGQLAGYPLNGAQYIPTRGGVTNALYLHAKARYAVWERLEIWGGPLVAVAPVPIVDPYTTRLSGGTATNSSGGDGSKRYYGAELDVGVRGRWDIRNFWLMAGVQGGVLLPGQGLANAAGRHDKVVGAIWLRTEIRY